MSIWLSISSQFDANIIQILGISGRILVPPGLNFLGQNDSIFSFSVDWEGNDRKLTGNWLSTTDI